MTFVESWYNLNFQMLQLAYSGVWLEIEPDAYEWIRIHNFPLPDSFEQQATRLLVLLPGLTKPIGMMPRHYYANQNLRLKSGRRPRNVFDTRAQHGAPDLSHLGYAYLCVIPTRWQPTQDVVSGDNLVTIVNLIYEQFEKGDRS